MPRSRRSSSASSGRERSVLWKDPNAQQEEGLLPRSFDRLHKIGRSGNIVVDGDLSRLCKFAELRHLVAPLTLLMEQAKEELAKERVAINDKPTLGKLLTWAEKAGGLPTVAQVKLLAHRRAAPLLGRRRSSKLGKVAA